MLVGPVTLRVCEFTIYCQLGLVLQVILLTIQVTHRKIFWKALSYHFHGFYWNVIIPIQIEELLNPGLLQNSSPIRMEAP